MTARLRSERYSFPSLLNANWVIQILGALRTSGMERINQTSVYSRNKTM